MNNKILEFISFAAIATLVQTSVAWSECNVGECAPCYEKCYSSEFEDSKVTKGAACEYNAWPDLAAACVRYHKRLCLKDCNDKLRFGGGCIPSTDGATFSDMRKAGGLPLEGGLTCAVWRQRQLDLPSDKPENEE